MQANDSKKTNDVFCSNALNTERNKYPLFTPNKKSKNAQNSTITAY